MFLLALIYLIILVLGLVGWGFPDRFGRIGGLAQWVLFAIIGFVLFWSILNK